MLKPRFGSLVIASIILCDVACWLVVTGADWAWLVAPAAIAAFAGSMRLRLREFAETNDQIGDAFMKIGALFLSVPVIVLLPLVHVGRYSRIGGWLTLALDGSIVAFLAFLLVGGIAGTVRGAREAKIQRWARIVDAAREAPAVELSGPIETTRADVARALSARFEDEAALRIETIGDAEFEAIRGRAAWYYKNPPIPPGIGRWIPVETALALAAVEVLEGAPRSLRRKRDQARRGAQR